MKRQTANHENAQYTRLPGKGSDDSDDEIEMFVRSKPKGFKEAPTIEKIVAEGDTLQSLSIRYNCSIAELKRLNTIHKENEIYARTKIKVPARPFSTIIAGVHDSGKSSPTESNVAVKPLDKSTLQDKLEITLSNTPTAVTDVNAIIFNSSVGAKERAFNDDGDLLDEDDCDVRLLPNSLPTQITNVSRSKWSCSGVDGDISLVALLVCIVIVIFTVPILYGAYIYEHPEQFHHKEHQHHSGA